MNTNNNNNNNNYNNYNNTNTNTNYLKKSIVYKLCIYNTIQYICTFTYIHYKFFGGSVFG